MEESTFNAEAPQASKVLPMGGLILTVAWIGVVVWYAVTHADDINRLAPHELAEFAAGACAPLAFLWLVLGFFQQGQELRYSGRALWLQGRELQHSVEQQRELVEVTREQLLFDSAMLQQQRDEIVRNSQPLLRITQGGSGGAGDGRRLYDFHLWNDGKPCTAVGMQFSSYGNPQTIPKLSAGESREFRLDLPVGEIEPIEVIVNYVDERLLHGSKRFLVRRAGNSFDIEAIAPTPS